MVLNKSTGKSLILSAVSFLWHGCVAICNWLLQLWKKSRVYGLMSAAGRAIAVSIRYSFLSRVTKIDARPSGILEESRIIRWLLNLYNRWKKKGENFSRSSFLFEFSKDTKEGFNFSFVRTTSITVLTLIIVNVLLSFGLHKEISLWGWFMRGLFFVFALFGLFSRADWQTTKNGSVFFKKIGINREK